MHLIRKRSVIRIHALLLACSLLWLHAKADGQGNIDKSSGSDNDIGTLIVQVLGLSSNAGNLRFVLFDSKENFLKRPVRAEIVQIDNRQGAWKVEGLRFGEYAVLVHHDVDASGKMERHWYGKPKEPTGASNDASAKFGPPKFKDAKFRLDSSEMTLTIRVK